MEGPQQTICHSVKLPCLSHFRACVGVLPLQRFPFLYLGELHQNSMQIVPSLRFLFPTVLDSMAAVPFPAGPWRGTLDGLTLRTHGHGTSAPDPGKAVYHAGYWDKLEKPSL